MNSDDQSFVRVAFYSDEKDFKNVISYILNYANDNNFLNPKLSKGTLFELYDEIIQDFNSLYGEDLILLKDGAQEMELFFNVGKMIDDNLKSILSSMMEKNLGHTKHLHDNDLTSHIYVDKDEEGQIAFIVDIPIDTPLGEEVSDSDEVYPFYAEDSHDYEDHEFVYPFNYDEEPNPIDNQEFFAPHESIVVPELLFNKMSEMAKDISLEYSEAFFSPLTRLRGATDEDIKLIHNQVISIIEILQFKQSRAYEPHWVEIVSFAYNNDGHSLSALSDFMTTQHESLSNGKINNIVRYDALVELQKHIVNITPNLPLNECAPLSEESQQLLAFIDYIGQAFALIEEGDFDE